MNINQNKFDSSTYNTNKEIPFNKKNDASVEKSETHKWISNKIIHIPLSNLSKSHNFSTRKFSNLTESIKNLKDPKKKDLVSFSVQGLGIHTPTLKRKIKEQWSDPSFVLEAIKKNAHLFENASENLKNDPDFLLEAMKINMRVLRYGGKLLDSPEFIKRAMDITPKAYRCASDEVKKNPEIIAYAIARDIPVYSDIRKLLKNNPDLTLYDLGIDFQTASAEQQNNFEFCLLAATDNYVLLQQMPNEFQDDFSFMSRLIDLAPRALKYASVGLKNNKDLVLKAVSKKGSTIQYASDHLKNDHDVICKAFSNDFSAIHHISHELKNDETLLLKLIQIDGEAMEFASDRLKNDREFALQAIFYSPSSVNEISENLKNDKTFIEEALDTNFHVWEYLDASLDIKFDKELEKLYEKYSAKKLINLLTSSLKNNFSKTLLGGALLNRHHLLQELKDKLSLCKNEKEVVYLIDSLGRSQFRCEEIHTLIQHILEYCSDDLKGDKDFILNMIKNPYVSLLHCVRLSEELKNDEEVMKKLILRYPEGVQFASTRLRNDKIFLKEIYCLNPEIFKFLPREIRRDPELFLDLNQMHCSPSTLSMIWKNIPRRFLRKEKFMMNLAQNGMFAAKAVNHDMLARLQKVLPQEMKENKDFLLAALEHADSLILHIANENVFHDKQFILECFHSLKNPHTIGEIFLKLPQNLKSDPEVLEALIAFSFEFEEIKNNRMVIQELVLYYPEEAYQFASPALKNDKRFLQQLYHLNPEVHDFLPTQLQHHQELFLDVNRLECPPSKMSKMWDHIPDALFSDKKFLTNLVQRGMFASKSISSHTLSRLTELLPQEIKEDKEFLLELIKRSPTIMVSIADKNVFHDKDFTLKCIDSLKNSHILQEMFLNFLPQN